MRNRAKCKLCNQIIESLAIVDYVTCKCEEITIWGGDQTYKAAARNWDNFLRVDDEGRECPVKIVDKLPDEPINIPDVKPLYMPPLTKEDKLKALDDIIESYESLPAHAMSQPASNYEILSVLLLVKSLLSD